MSDLANLIKSTALASELHKSLGPAIQVQAAVDKIMSRGHLFSDIDRYFSTHNNVISNFATKKMLDSDVINNIANVKNYLAPPSELKALQEIISQRQNLFAFEGLDSVPAFHRTIGQSFKVDSTIAGIRETLLANRELFGNSSLFGFPSEPELITGQYFKNINYALADITSILAKEALRTPSEKILENFQAITSEASGISKSVTEENINNDDFKARLQNLLQLLRSFILKYEKKGEKAILYVSLFITLHQYVDFISKPDAVTKQDLIENNKIFLKTLKEENEKVNEYHTLIKRCKVMMKPANKGRVVLTLPQGYNVNIIASHHKWILITYNSPKDGLPEMGWVLRKYCKK